MTSSRPDASTADPSPTSHQPTLPGLDSVTSSPGSAGGPAPSDSPESPTTPPSGPGRAPASPSRTRARGAGFATLDIFGRHGSRSSGSAALQSSLESRLRARLASSGSTLFSLTWRDAVTPSGRRICALRASGRHTSDSGCTSWPTPTVSRGDYSYAHGNPETPTLKLAGAAKLAAWPTPLANGGAGGGSERHIDGRRSNLRDTVHLASWPTAAARDWKSSASNKHGDNARPLNEVARLASWPTPLRADGQNRKLHYQHGPTNLTLLGAAMLMSISTASWATPAAQEPGGTPEQALERKRKRRAKGADLGLSVTSLSHQVQLADSGPTPTGSSAETRAEDRPSPGQLNPEHSRWLQGYPAAWGSCRGTATRSSRK